MESLTASAPQPARFWERSGLSKMAERLLPQPRAVRPAQPAAQDGQVAGWDSAPLNLELLFCTDVLQLESLHYGYWDRREAVDLEGIRRAQARYTATMLDLIPAGVQTVLDVGCGIGDVAGALADRGFTVTGISPDANHVRYFAGGRPGVTFHQARFEEFTPPHKYDLILMSETQNYFDMLLGLEKTAESLNPGGYLLISGMFGRSRARAFAGCHVAGEYIRCAAARGLELRARLDITDNVLPTLEHSYQCFHDFVTPTMRIMQRYLGRGAGFKLRVLGLLLGRELHRLDRLQTFYEERFNPFLFRLNMQYLRLLFQRGAGAAHAAPPVE